MPRSVSQEGAFSAHTCSRAAQGLKSACCGMIFNTKGFMEAAQSQCNSLEQSLLKASDNGNIPIVLDTSPCLGQLKGGLTEKGLK